MKKYNILYAKATAVWIIGFSALVGALLFIVSLFADVLEYDMVVPFVVLLTGTIIWIINLSRIIFAAKLLKTQKNDLKVQFDDRGATALSPRSAVYLSDSWLIVSGRLYLHIDFIESASIKYSKNSMGNDCYCQFKCKDRSRKVHMDSVSNARRIKKWYDEKKLIDSKYS